MAAVNQPVNILDKIAELERQITELRGRVGLSSATVTRGTLAVQGGAEFGVKHPSGHNMFLVGRAPGYDIYQVSMRRSDGTIAWAVATDSVTLNQFVAHWDRAGNIIACDDPIAGEGLARPHLDIPMYPGRAADWQSTTSPTFETLWSTQAEAQHPCLSWAIGAGDNGASGEVRLRVGGVTISPTYTYTAGNPTTYSDDLPHGAVMHSGAIVDIQARRTSGGGALYIRPWHLRGVGLWA